jgi:hypothetical protein
MGERSTIDTPWEKRLLSEVCVPADLRAIGASVLSCLTTMRRKQPGASRCARHDENALRGALAEGAYTTG